MTFTPVSLPDHMDYLMRPVLEGMCRMESLYDGTLSLDQVALMNDALDVKAENMRRQQQAMEAANGR